MNSLKNLSQVIPAMEVTEGGGVTVHRTIGTPALRNYDPFMLLDHIGSNNPDEYIAGFPSHPHRGFNTFTYMIDGDMEHKDSMGNTGNLGPGGAQWMKAASGVIHSEMPRQENGLLRGFQLWINLPSANKMDMPEYQEYTSDAFPVVDTEEYSTKVIIGDYENTRSPINDEITNVSYFDISVKPDQHFSYSLPDNQHSFIYVFEGSGNMNDQNIPAHSLVTLGNNSTMSFVANNEGARFIFVSGKPIKEKVVQYGPFVMNTEEEIHQAMQDYQSNQLVKDKAWVNRNK